MKIKVAKLERQLHKVMKEEFAADGTYVRIDDYSIHHTDGEQTIEITGAYGIEVDDGKFRENKLNLWYPDGKSIDFIRGMFYQVITNADGWENEINLFNDADGDDDTDITNAGYADDNDDDDTDGTHEKFLDL